MASLLLEVPPAPSGSSFDGEALIRKITARLVPFMCFLYLLAYLDRVNVGFASLQMTTDLHLSDAVYGLGAGIFFLGYFIFEVPSNLMLHRTGASKWIARIMITWGILAAAMMFTRGAWSFCSMRLLLGMAEAGFFPGMVLYITYWFPRRYRARTTAFFFTATALAGLIGGPMSGALLELDGFGGLRGWQWLFLIEGVPSVFAGVAVLFYLTDRPSRAKWLDQPERDWLAAELAADSAQSTGNWKTHLRFTDALRDPRLWLLGVIYFVFMMGLYAVSYWMPRILKDVTHFTDAKVGLLSAIPFGLAVIAMILVGRHSDRVRERRKHVAACAVVAAIGLSLSPFCHTPLTAILALSLAAIGIWSAVGPFWAITGDFLSGTAAAGGIAAINSFGNLGGFASPYLIGLIRTHMAGFNGGLLVIAGGLLIGGVLVMVGISKPAVRS